MDNTTLHLLTLAYAINKLLGTIDWKILSRDDKLVPCLDLDIQDIELEICRTQERALTLVNDIRIDTERAALAFQIPQLFRRYTTVGFCEICANKYAREAVEHMITLYEKGMPLTQILESNRPGTAAGTRN